MRKRNDDNDKDNGCLKILQKLVPHYNGLFHDDHMNIDYIRLEDITAHMMNISLLDVKIGYITYDPEASEEKRRAEMSKYKYAKDLGFRILGMRVCLCYFVLFFLAMENVSFSCVICYDLHKQL